MPQQASGATAVKVSAAVPPTQVTEALSRQQQYWDAIFAQVTEKYLRAMPPTTAMALAIASQAHAKAAPKGAPTVVPLSQGQALQAPAGQGCPQPIPAKARPQERHSAASVPLERKRKVSIT